MENICGVYRKQVGEPRYYFDLKESKEPVSNNQSVELYLVDESGKRVFKLLSLVNRGGSWRCLFWPIDKEFRELFEDNLDLDGAYLHSYTV